MVKLNTKFWKKDDANHYKDKIVAFMWTWLIFFMVNLIAWVYMENWFLVCTNLIPILLSIMIIKSNMNHNAEERIKEEEKNGKKEIEI